MSCKLKRERKVNKENVKTLIEHYTINHNRNQS